MKKYNNFKINKDKSFAKVICKNISDLQELLMHKINTIDGIQRTDTFISLNQPIDRNITL